MNILLPISASISYLSNIKYGATLTKDYYYHLLTHMSFTHVCFFFLLRSTREDVWRLFRPFLSLQLEVNGRAKQRIKKWQIYFFIFRVNHPFNKKKRKISIVDNRFSLSFFITHHLGNPMSKPIHKHCYKHTQIWHARSHIHNNKCKISQKHAIIFV